MRSRDFADLAHTTPAQAIAKLSARGYTLLPGGGEGILFTGIHPDHPGTMLRLSFRRAAQDALARICAADPENPVLPRIHSHHDLPGAHGLAITVMERLLAPAELPPEQNRPLIGAARALAALPAGDAHHGDVHRHMLRKDHMRRAVEAFARAIADSADSPNAEALRYDSGMDETLPVDDRISAHVLLRRDGSLWRPVFAQPLVRVPVTEPDRQNLRAAAAAMQARLAL